MARTLLRFRREFDASHQLPYHRGKCRNLHGHRYKIEVALRGHPAPDYREPGAENHEGGMLVDFEKLKELLDRILPDHKHLNAEGSGTVAERLYEIIESELCTIADLERVQLHQVRVWETPNGDATYPAR